MVTRSVNGFRPTVSTFSGRFVEEEHCDWSIIAQARAIFTGAGSSKKSPDFFRASAGLFRRVPALYGWSISGSASVSGIPRPSSEDSDQYGSAEGDNRRPCRAPVPISGSRGKSRAIFSRARISRRHSVPQSRAPPLFQFERDTFNNGPVLRVPRKIFHS